MAHPRVAEENILRHRLMARVQQSSTPPPTAPPYLNRLETFDLLSAPIGQFLSHASNHSDIMAEVIEKGVLPPNATNFLKEGEVLMERLKDFQVGLGNIKLSSLLPVKVFLPMSTQFAEVSKRFNHLHTLLIQKVHSCHNPPIEHAEGATNPTPSSHTSRLSPTPISSPASLTNTVPPPSALVALHMATIQHMMGSVGPDSAAVVTPR